MDHIYEKLNEIFQDVFDDDRLTINADTTPNDIEGWDSLANINIIVSIESEFGVKFKMEEISSMKSIGDIARFISKEIEK